MIPWTDDERQVFMFLWSVMRRNKKQSNVWIHMPIIMPLLGYPQRSVTAYQEMAKYLGLKLRENGKKRSKPRPKSRSRSAKHPGKSSLAGV